MASRRETLYLGRPSQPVACRRSGWLLVVGALGLLGLLLLSASGKAASGTLPEEIYSNTSVRLWTSAKAAQDAHGKLRPDLFSAARLSYFESNSVAIAKLRSEAQDAKTSQASPGSFEADCPGWTDADVRERAGRKQASTIEGMVRNSIAIVRGRVVASEYGFSGEQPALLIGLEVERTLVASPELADSGRLYFVYPYAAFSAGGLQFCKKPNRSAARPEDGDEVLLFVFYPPVGLDRQLVLPDHEEVLFQHKGGALSLPWRLATDPELFGKDGIEPLERLVERIISAGDGR